MITLYVEENNPITPDFYNSVLNNLQFHQLKCPCGQSGCLSVHGYYNRYIKTEDGKVLFRICRVKCNQCGRTHALLLSSMVPYSQISFRDHLQIITAHEYPFPKYSRVPQYIEEMYKEPHSVVTKLKHSSR